MRAPVNQVCPVAEYEPPDDPEDGINEKVEEILAERRNDRKVSSWADLWRVLFANDNEIPPCSMYSSFRILSSYLLTAAAFVPPKVVEIPEVIDTIKSITTGDGGPELTVANAYPSYPQRSTHLIAELETRLGALCENEATASPRIFVDGSTRSDTTELLDYTGMPLQNQSSSTDPLFVGSISTSHRSDDTHR